MYIGRASASPTLDLLITLLSLGVCGYKQQLVQRKEMYTYLVQKLSRCAERNEQRLLNIQHNPISCGKKTLVH